MRKFYIKFSVLPVECYTQIYHWNMPSDNFKISQDNTYITCFQYNYVLSSFYSFPNIYISKPNDYPSEIMVISG